MILVSAFVFPNLSFNAVLHLFQSHILLLTIQYYEIIYDFIYIIKKENVLQNKKGVAQQVYAEKSENKGLPDILQADRVVTIGKLLTFITAIDSLKSTLIDSSANRVRNARKPSHTGPQSRSGCQFLAYATGVRRDFWVLQRDDRCAFSSPN